MLSVCTSKISSFHFNETKLLNQKLEQEKLKLEQQSAKVEKLQLTCAEYIATIKQLNEANTKLRKSNKDLQTQLQEKEELLESLNNSSTIDTESEEEEMSFESCEQETTTYNKRVSSLSFSYSSSPIPHVREKRCHSELTNQHTGVSRTNSIEDKVKAYQEKLKIYRNKCQSLKAEKKSLKNDKFHLQIEVSMLKEQLDTVSISSHSSLLSHHKGLSQSCSSLLERDLVNQVQARQESEQITVEESSSSYLSRIASFIKNPVSLKRVSRVVSPEPQHHVMSMSEISDILPENKDFLNPIFQGWLTKEGGNKKILRKRWCVLSSQFFRYYERENDPKPLGILPLTKDMEVADSAKENWFEIFNKSRTNMNSCKLDKSKGNHASYNLQASCDDDKKNWIEVFQKVLETLKTPTS